MKTNIGLIAAVMLLSATAFGQITPSSSTTSWTPIQYGAGNIPDPSADQQTGSSEGDVVGNISNPSLYTAFDNGGTTGILTDGQLGFRFRVGADKSPAGYKGAAFVGLDLDANGSLDVFAGVNNSGSSSLVGLWWAGTGANISPSTTTIAGTPTYSYAETAANYSWMAVTSLNDPTATTFDIDGGGDTDYFLTFVLPFADLVTMAATLVPTFNEASVISYVAATATQANSLNQDLNGVTGGVNSTATWTSLGAMSLPFTASGGPFTPVPEPSVLAMLSLGVAGLLGFRRRKQARSV